MNDTIINFDNLIANQRKRFRMNSEDLKKFYRNYITDTDKLFILNDMREIIEEQEKIINELEHLELNKIKEIARQYTLDELY